MSNFWKTINPFHPISVILVALLSGLSLAPPAGAQTGPLTVVCNYNGSAVTTTKTFSVQVSSDPDFATNPVTIINTAALSGNPPYSKSTVITLAAGTYYVGAELNVTGAGKQFPIPTNNPVIGAPFAAFNAITNNNYDNTITYPWPDGGGTSATPVGLTASGTAVTISFDDSYPNVGFSGGPNAASTGGGVVLTQNSNQGVTIGSTVNYFWGAVYPQNPLLSGTGPGNQTLAKDWGAKVSSNMNISCVKDLKSTSPVYVLLYLDPTQPSVTSGGTFQEIQTGDPYTLIGPVNPQTANITGINAGAVLGVTIVTSATWSGTYTPTSGATATATSAPTDTPTLTPSSTPTDTPTDSPSSTPTLTPTITETLFTTATATASPTDSPTDSPTSTPTETATTTPSNSPTATATAGASLAPGAVVFTGFLQNGNSEFGFVSPVGLGAGQVIYFTNESYSASANALVSFTGQTTQVTGGTIAEGIISYTVGGGGLSAFSQVVISKVSSVFQGGTISGALTLNKDGSGHKLLAFTVPSAGVTQYLAGLIFGPDTWLPNGTAPTTFYDSNLPPGLDSTTSTDLSNLWNGDGFNTLANQQAGNNNAVLTCQTTLAGIVNPWNWNADVNVPKTALEIGGTLIGVTACPVGNAGWSGSLPSQAVNASPSPTATSSGATATPTLTFTVPPTFTPTDSLTPTVSPTFTDTLVLTATPTDTFTSTSTPTITPTVNSNPGLVAFTAFLYNGNSEFGFVAPSGLAANQTVYFTNEAYDATANSGSGGLVDLTGPDPAAPGNGVTESIISFTAPATGLGSYVPVVIAWLKNDSDRLQGGTLAWVSGNGAVTNFLVLNHNGEGHKILAFTIPSAGVTQYVAALIFGPNGWQTTGSVARYWDSYLPPGLDNTDSLDLSGLWNENGLGAYPVDGNQNAVLNSCQTTLAGIVNAANWAADANVSKGNLALDVPVAVTVCPDGSAGWTGTIPPNGASSSTTPIPTWTPTPIVTPSVGVVTRGPFLQLSTASSIVVRWRTQVSEDSKVYYGTLPGSLLSLKTDSASVTDHAVTVTGLSANTKYYYAVGSGAAATEAGPGTDYFFKTSPVAGTAQPVRLWAFGDEGQSSIPTNDGVVQRATRDAYYSYTGTTPTDLIVSLGDNAYNSGFDSEFQISVFDFYNGILRNTPFWPGIGNHETDGTAPYDYFKQFTFPVNGEAGGLPSGTPNYYSFNYANIHLVELDAQLSDRSVSAPMWTWLNNDLSANTQPWIIAYWHHAPYSHGSHNSDTDPQMTDMRRNFCSLLEQYGAALVLTGHSHDYERSYFMDGFYGTSAQFNASYEKQPGYGRPGTDGPYLKAPGSHTGTVYAVVGSTGEQNTGGTLDHAANIANSPLAGTLVVDINGNVLNAQMLGIGGTVLDNFAIQRVVASTPTATAANSATSSPSMTPTSTPTNTLSSTPTNSATSSPTNSATSSPTLTATDSTTPTPSATLTATASPSPTPTNSPTSTATSTPTNTLTNSPTLTVTLSCTLTPSFTPTSTPTSGLSLATLTPTQSLSGLGKVVLAPMPLRTGDNLCLYPEKPLASSHWEIFNLMGESIAKLSFDTGYSDCWPTQGVAPGIYLVRMKLTYADGHTETVSKRIVIRR